MEAAAALSDWMTALADPTRARALRLVERNELAVSDLCAVLQLPQSTVSRHLKVLADDGWVTARQDGTSRLYRAACDALAPAARRLWALVREQTALTPAATQDDRRLGAILAERKSRSQAFFSSSAGQWDRLRREMYGDRFHLRALAGLFDAAWTVGDLACGTGQLAEAVAPFVRRVVAVDGSREMLRAAHQRLDGLPNVDLRRGDLEALPLDDATLDAAIVSLALHHVAEPGAVVHEAARVLAPRGRLLVIDMLAHDRTEYQQEMGHLWLGFEPAQVTAWLESAGLHDVRVQPLPPEPSATGPALFAAAARRGDHSTNGRTPHARRTS